MIPYRPLCHKCRQRKTEAEMHIERGHTRNLCKECRNNTKRVAMKANPVLRAKDRERSQTRRKTMHPTGITLAKMDELKKKYGMTPEEFQAMYDAQNGRCKICKEPLTAGKGGSVVDHNHKTERVRGLLCNGCNSGIGWFKENPDRLIAAIAYLEEDHAVRWSKATVDVQCTANDIELPSVGSFW